ncbi:hypothetical protein [Shewanella fodinae]|uniref:hypothetical protein n=1 Tax=Shewanella fodinae TaxID=552357 RepID=UPI001675AF64|nr:hypothetical protein [Shewanella fodinae]MCL2907873.1 hypothetical protein [Shewanella fodinae]GGZ11325.1 hypothetical protein GCM10007169_29800 [Shewanella fodinae]
MRKVLMAIGTAFLASCASTSPSTHVTSVHVDLPQSMKWSVVSDRADNSQYIKEWVPEGENPATSKWIITEQMLTISSKTSAESFQKQMFGLSRQGCTDVLFNGPQEIDVSGHKTSVGRIMCANQLGKPFGTFTDQRVIIDGTTAYVVTSELRIPVSPKAGVLAFGKDQLAEMKEFMLLQRASSKFVRESVKVQVQ